MNFMDKVVPLMIPGGLVEDKTISGGGKPHVKFMALMQGSHAKLVPTLDVDLFWHTHQLAPVAYHAWYERNIGRRINHDDTISKGTLEGAFITTKDAWDQRYHEEYMFITRDPTMLPDLRAKLKASEQCKTEAEKALEDYDSRFHDWETIALETESKNKKEIKELAARLGEIIVL